MSLCTIVGMGPGIGFSVAKRFAKEGFDIAMIARNPGNLKSYTEILEKNHDIFVYSFVADAGNGHQLDAAFTNIRKRCGRTEVLVYNAAVMEKNIWEISGEKLTDHLKVNVGGAMVAAQQVVSSMQIKGKGTIIFTGGGFALEPNPHYFSLSVGKAALLSYGLDLAEQYEPTGIHVAVVNIYGKVAPRTNYDPDLIAEKYWELHTQPREKWEREVQVK